MKAWIKAEDEFEASYRAKNQFVFQFMDARAIMGEMQSKRIMAGRHPSDFIVCDNGEFFFAEVKRSENATSFPFANIKKTQWHAAIRTVAANGLYYFFIRHDPAGQWYRVPAQVLLKQLEVAKSIKWTDLKPYEWKL